MSSFTVASLLIYHSGPATLTVFFISLALNAAMIGPVRGFSSYASPRLSPISIVIYMACVMLIGLPGTILFNRYASIAVCTLQDFIQISVAIVLS